MHPAGEAARRLSTASPQASTSPRTGQPRGGRPWARTAPPARRCLRDASRTSGTSVTRTPRATTRATGAPLPADGLGRRDHIDPVTRPQQPYRRRVGDPDRRGHHLDRRAARSAGRPRGGPRTGRSAAASAPRAPDAATSGRRQGEPGGQRPSPTGARAAAAGAARRAPAAGAKGGTPQRSGADRPARVEEPAADGGLNRTRERSTGGTAAGRERTTSRRTACRRRSRSARRRSLLTIHRLAAIPPSPVDNPRVVENPVTRTGARPGCPRRPALAEPRRGPASRQLDTPVHPVQRLRAQAVPVVVRGQRGHRVEEHRPAAGPRSRAKTCSTSVVGDALARSPRPRRGR